MDTRFSLLVVLVAWVASAPAADPPRPTPESLRATTKLLWSNNVDEAIAAVKILEAEPLALAVLRRALATDANPRHQGDLERLIAKAVARQDRVNAERVGKWYEGGRLDMLTEVRALTNGKAADAATEYLLRAALDLREVGFALKAPTPPNRVERSDPWENGLGRKQSQMTQLFDDELILNKVTRRTGCALFADRLDMPCGDVSNSLVVSRSRLTHLTIGIVNTVGRERTGRCQWVNSLLFANTSVQLEEFAGCVLVVDGDVELVPGADLGGSIIVANGNVRESKDYADARAYKSVVWAAGDITMTPHNRRHDSLFFAGGKVANAEKLALKGCVEENVKEPPLPVRFLDPAEFGLKLEADKEGMKVTKVADKSAFAEGGLKAGDVIVRVGEVATATAPAFRRELRRGVIEGTVLLDVIRGKEKVELLVPVPDVPAAPKKKGDLKAPPPDKK